MPYPSNTALTIYKSTRLKDYGFKKIVLVEDTLNQTQTSHSRIQRIMYYISTKIISYFLPKPKAFIELFNFVQRPMYSHRQFNKI